MALTPEQMSIIEAQKQNQATTNVGLAIEHALRNAGQPEYTNEDEELFNSAFPEHTEMKDMEAMGLMNQNETPQVELASAMNVPLSESRNDGTIPSKSVGKYSLSGVDPSVDEATRNQYLDSMKNQEIGSLQDQEDIITSGMQPVGDISDTSFIENKMKEVIEQQSSNIKDRTKFLETLKTDVNDFSNQLKNAEIDTSKFWEKKGTWDKILVGIGLTLSGLTPHTMQAAASFVNNAIQNDIEAQKANIQKKDSIYNKALVRYGNEVDAQIATEYKYMNALKSVFDVYYKKAMFPNQKNAIMETRNKVIKSSLDNIQRLNTIRGTQLAYGLSNQIISGGPIKKDTIDKMKISPNPQQRAIAAKLIDGFTGMANSPQAKEETDKEYLKYLSTNKLLNKALKLNDKISVGVALTPQAIEKALPKAEMNFILGELKSKYVTDLMKVGGKVTDTDLRIAEESIGDLVSSKRNANIIRKVLQRFAEVISDDFKQFAISKGFKDVAKYKQTN